MEILSSYVSVTWGVCWSDLGDVGGWVKVGEWATIQAQRAATMQWRIIPADGFQNQNQGKTKLSMIAYLCMNLEMLCKIAPQ